MIEIINSSTLFVGNKSTSNITILEISEVDELKNNSINSYQNKYINIFNLIYAKIIRNKYTDDIVKKKHDIKIFKETNKKRRLLNFKFLDTENNIIHISSSPIINNNKIFGIAIVSLFVDEKNNDLGLTSFILFNFYILFICVTIFLSLFFIRGLIIPLKQLSYITLLERQKIRNNSLPLYQKKDIVFL